jgi:hypothetical protein
LRAVDFWETREERRGLRERSWLRRGGGKELTLSASSGDEP